MSWTIEEVIDMDTTSPSAMRIGFDGNIEAHVFWWDGASPYNKRHAWRNAGVWETEVVGTGGNGRAAVRGDKLAWAYAKRNGHDLDLHIMTATVGGSWSDTVVYTWVAQSWTSGGGLTYWENLGGSVDVGIDSTGKVHVLVCIYSSSTTSHLPPWAKALYFNDDAWTPTTLLDAGDYVTCEEYSYGRALVIDSGDDVHCLWEHWKTYDSPYWQDIKYATSVDSWAVETVYDFPDYTLSKMVTKNLAIDSTGVAHALYYINEDGTEENTHRYLNKQPWSSPETLAWTNVASDDAALEAAGLDIWTIDSSGANMNFCARTTAGWGIEPIIAGGYVPDIALHPVDVSPWVAFGESAKIKVAYRGRAKPWWFLI